jgi:hypothetical protein
MCSVSPPTHSGAWPEGPKLLAPSHKNSSRWHDMALLSMWLCFHNAPHRPGAPSPPDVLWSLPREAACKRQFPSPVVAKGRSRLQLVHTVDHQFRRPGTEDHFRIEAQQRQGPGVCLLSNHKHQCIPRRRQSIMTTFSQIKWRAKALLKLSKK